MPTQEAAVDGRAAEKAVEGVMDRRAFTVATLAAEWECSEGVIRKVIATGELGCFRLGTLIRIPVEEVRRFECQAIQSNASEADMQSSGVTNTASAAATRSKLPIAPQPKRRRGHGGLAKPTQHARLAG
jgi:excisionase family DNA binding protein